MRFVYLLICLFILFCVKLSFASDIINPIIDLSKDECLVEIDKKKEMLKDAKEYQKSSYLEQIGDIYYNLKDYDNAIKYYLMSSNNTDTNNILIAQSYDKLDMLDKAVSYYKKINEESSSYIPVMSKLIDISKRKPNIVNNKDILNELLNLSEDKITYHTVALFIDTNKIVNKDNKEELKQKYKDWLNKNRKSIYTPLIATSLYRLDYPVENEEIKIISDYVNKYYKNNIYGYDLMYMLACGYFNKNEPLLAAKVLRKIINDSKKGSKNEKELAFNISKKYNMLIIAYNQGGQYNLALKMKNEFRKRFPDEYKNYF